MTVAYFVFDAVVVLMVVAALLFLCRADAPAQSTQRTPVDVAGLVEAGEADGLDFYFCPGEQRRRPHAVGVDGSRTCWTCGHCTLGDQT